MAKKLTAVVMIICIGITALTGCGKKTVSKAVLKNDMEKIEINDIGVSKDDSQPYWGTYVHTFAAADGGYYYIGKWNKAFFLLFFDRDTKECYPVCGKADCTHDNMECNAYVGYQYSKNRQTTTYYLDSAVYYYKDNVYLLDTNGYLVRFSTDGSTREKIAVVYAYGGESGTNLVFHDDYVYVYNLLGHLGNEEEAVETIKRYSLDGKKEETVLEYTGTGAAITRAKSYGERLYFLIETATMSKDEKANKVIMNSRYNSLYAYDYKTGTAGKVLEGSITDYCIDEVSGNIYYYEYNDGMYCYNVKSKEKNKIFDGSEETRKMELSFDGKYVYADNRFWSIEAARSYQTYDRKCVVYSTDGKLINTISCKGETFAFFGDEDYMFAEVEFEEKSSSGSKSGLAYIKKDDMGKECKWTELK